VTIIVGALGLAASIRSRVWKPRMQMIGTAFTLAAPPASAASQALGAHALRLSWDEAWSWKTVWRSLTRLARSYF